MMEQLRVSLPTLVAFGGVLSALALGMHALRHRVRNADVARTTFVVVAALVWGLVLTIGFALANPPLERPELGGANGGAGACAPLGAVLELPQPASCETAAGIDGASLLRGATAKPTKTAY